MSMEVIGKAMQLKLGEAVHLLQGMMAENSMRQEMIGNLPSDRQQRERQRLARDRDHIEILAKILQDLVASTMECVRDRDFHGEAVQAKLLEILRLGKGMLAEYRMGMDMLDGLPPECQEDESQRLTKDVELIHNIIGILHGVADAIIQSKEGG